MITTAVDEHLQAVIPLAVRGSQGREHQIQALIDTGFNGFLTLPPNLVHELELPWVIHEQGELADGSVGMFDVHEAAVLWDGRWMTVEVDAMNAQPLLGMSLMRGYKLEVDVKSSGVVRLNPLA